MAINLTIRQFRRMTEQPGGRSQVPEWPAVDGDNVTAAGELPVAQYARFVEVQNNTAGDSVLVTVRAAGSGNASLANGVQIVAGTRYVFGIPRDNSGSNYEVDIRAG